MVETVAGLSVAVTVIGVLLFAVVRRLISINDDLQRLSERTARLEERINNHRNGHNGRHGP